MKFLKTLLQGEDDDRFLRENYGRLPYSRPGAAATYVGSLTDKDFRQMFAARTSRFRVVKGQKMVCDAFVGSYGGLEKLLHEEHSLVVRHAERSHPLLAALAEDLTQIFSAPVDVQIFRTPPGLSAFGWHYDLENVFVVQLEGEKKFTLRPNTINPRPTRENMKKDLEFEKERSRVLLHCDLSPGDWLHIPTGWWHVAQAVTWSTHLSIGLMPPV